MKNALLIATLFFALTSAAQIVGREFTVSVPPGRAQLIRLTPTNYPHVFKITSTSPVTVAFLTEDEVGKTTPGHTLNSHDFCVYHNILDATVQCDSYPRTILVVLTEPRFKKSDEENRVKVLRIR